MNIYDEKRRNSVEAYCAVQLLSPTERCIQLEDQLAEARATIEKIKTLPTFKTVGFYRQQIDEILGEEGGL